MSYRGNVTRIKAAALGTLAAAGVFCVAGCFCVVPPLVAAQNVRRIHWPTVRLGLLVSITAAVGFGWVVGRDWYRNGRPAHRD